MFDFFSKFLRAFNSAQRTWQIALAITLGFIMGLTPVSGLQTLLLLFIAFVINVPLGLFFFMATNFAFIGYLFDPYFEAFGYYLLTLPELEAFWTTLYNSGVARLSYFDNTIVLGSTLLAVVLAIPLMVILVFIINKFRPAIQALFNKYKILRMFGLFKEDDGEKKPKAIRVWGVALFTLLTGGMIVFAYFFMDSLFKWGIESSASSLLDKEVKVRSAQVDLQNAKVVIEGLSVQNATTQTFYAEKMVADIDFNALLLFKTHIERLSIEGMRFDQLLAKKTKTPTTTTSTQKSVPKVAAKKEQSAPKEEEQKSSSDAPLLPDVKTLLANEELNTSKRYEEAKVLIDETTQKYDDVVNKEFGKSYQKTKDKELEAIKKSSDIKTLEDIKTLQSRVDTFKKGIEADKRRIDTLQKELGKDKKTIEQAIDAIKKAKDDDFNALKSKYTFDKEGAFNVVGSLFGSDIQGYIEMADEYYTMLAPYLESDEEEPTPKERHKGRWITFKQDTPNAGFIVYEAKVEGAYEKRPFSGVLHDVSSNQKSVGRPITFTIKSESPGMQGVVIQGEDNRLGKQVADTIDVRIAKIPDVTMDMHLLKLHQSNLAIDEHLTLLDGKNLSSTTQLLYKDTDLKVHNLEGRIATTLAKEIQKTDSFTIDILANGELLTPEIEIKTSLEAIVKNAFDKAMAAEVKHFEKELNAELNKKLKEALGDTANDKAQLVDVEKLLKGEKGALDGLSKEGDRIVKEKENALNKEIEQKKKAAQKALEAEKKRAEKKAKKAIKKAVPKELNKYIKF